jgi:hypothetical protein
VFLIFIEMKKLLFLLPVVFFVACKKDQKELNLPVKDLFIYQSALNCDPIYDYDYFENFMAFADDIYSEYGMEVFCACDCLTWTTLSQAMNDRISSFPNLFIFGEVRPFDCVTGPEVFGDFCEKDILKKKDQLKSLLSQLSSIVDSTTNEPFLNNAEKYFLENLITSVYLDQNIVLCDIYSNYSNLAFNSNMSQQFISHSVGFLEAVIEGHIEIWGPDLTNGDNTAGLIVHALSGLFGAWTTSMKYVWDNRRCIECGNPDDLFYEMAWGFAGGAIGAV